MDPLKIHSMPSAFRRPIMILAFTGWNDAAESATTAARYLTASFSGEKFAEIDPEEFSHFGLRPSRYEGPTGIIGVLNTLCRDRELPAASLWANVPHYISGIENPKASLALVKRVLSLLGAEADLSDLDEAGRQFDQNLKEIVAQNTKIASYIAKLEAKDTEEEGVQPGQRDLPPASG